MKNPREIKSYSTPAKPGCYMPRNVRAGYIATINESSLHASAKRVLKWLVGFGEPVMSLGIDSIAARLPCKTKDGSSSAMSRSTIKRVLRMIDDSSDDGLAVLRLVQKERHGAVPCAYEIDLHAITYIRLECIAGTAASHNKRAVAGSLAGSQGGSLAGSLEGVHIHQSEPVFIRCLNSGVSAVAAERLPAGVDLSSVKRFGPVGGNVFQFTGRRRDTMTFSHHEKASSQSDSFDDVNADLRAACDEAMYSLAARGFA